MIQHFDNLQTPLKSVHAYPQLADQERRFLGSGWSKAVARSLWDIFNDADIVPSDQRLALNDVEPFDEWEEFVLFGCHYFLLVADQGSLMQSRAKLSSLQDRSQGSDIQPGNDTLVAHSEIIPKSNLRRFGAAFSLSPDTVGHHGGLGPQHRLSSMDVYVRPEKEPLDPPNIASIEPRMCHTITACNPGSLLAGGRTSPEHALRDCWLFREACWERVEDLPTPLYRHCATQVTLETEGQSILIYGGKTKGNCVSNQWLLWRQYHGWVQVIIKSSDLTPRFGSVIASTGSARGILLGGMTADGTILNDFWEWTLETGSVVPKIELSKLDAAYLQTPNVTGRMGACLTRSSIGLLLIGGVCSDILAQDHNIICLSKGSSDEKLTAKWNWTPVDSQITGQCPLLVGHSTCALGDCVAVLGGGAFCFSFGTYWNTGIITLSTGNGRGFSATQFNDQRAKPPSHEHSMDNLRSRQASAQRLTLHSTSTFLTKSQLKLSKDFEEVLNQRRPVVMTAADLGSCVREWTLDSLKDKVGYDRVVSLRYYW